jgi:preprotein translocase subunit SecF
MEFFKIRRTLPFMRYALVFNIISLATFVLAVVFLAVRGLNLSIEFTGGTLIEVSYPAAAEVDHIREVLEKGGYKAEVQNFGSSREVLIRLHEDKSVQAARENAAKSAAPATAPVAADASAAAKQSGAGQLSERVLELLRTENKAVELRRVEFVGPTVGEELAWNGALALLITAVGIVLYLAFRFEWRFGLAGIIANLHDVVIILGFFALFQWEFSLPVLAAVLAVLGYSVNESVVVFDRVRENFRKLRRATTPEVIDSAITGVISRTIITHGCTQAMVTTMLLFGGAALHYFALALTIGILFGIYSSVLVASPLLMWLGVSRAQFAAVAGKKKRGEDDENFGATV